jgi:hypothetical protein
MLYDINYQQVDVDLSRGSESVIHRVEERLSDGSHCARRATECPPVVGSDHQAGHLTRER